MLFPNPKIPFYKQRIFGERFNATFDFLRETWKPILKYASYLILPICLIQAFTSNSFLLPVSFYSLTDLDLYSGSMSLLFKYGAATLCVLIGACMLSALIYTLMQEYERRENRLLDITWSDFKSPLSRNLIKVLKATLLSSGLTFAGMFIFDIILSAMSIWMMLLVLLLLTVTCIAIIVPLALFIPTYLFEDRPLLVALERAFKFGFSAWADTFLMMIIFGLLAGIVYIATMIPWYVLIFMKNLFIWNGEITGVTASWGYEFLTYLTGIMQACGSYLAQIIVVVGMAFQYFHLREKTEGVSVNESISKFDQL